MVKAAAGGGGRGIRRVDALGDLHAAFESASAEARKAFGDGTLLLERVLAAARHVEVQVIADGYGTVWAVRRARLHPAAAQPEGPRGVAPPGAQRRTRSASSATPPCA